MPAFTAPGIGILRRTPEIVGWLVADLDEAGSLWKPAPGRWCVLEVVGHLADVEARSRGRAAALMTESNPLLAIIDPDHDAAAGLYTARPLRAALDAFAAEREESLRLLERVREEDLARAGVHAEYGPVTLGQFLNEWPLHDLGHVLQIAELVRAHRYYPRIGPWGRIYRLSP